MNGTDMQVGEDPTFERTGTAVVAGTSRRTALRGLAAALLAATSGGMATDTPAKTRRKKRKQKPKKTPPTTPPTNPPTTPPTTPLPKRCPLRTSIAYLTVRADGSQTFTPVLEEGQNYILRASGYWSTNGEYMCDAFAAFLWKDPRSPVLYHNGVRLGLAINGETPDLWGSYTQSHTYEFGVTGKGKPISLQMLDSVYSDNGRLLNVELLCGAPSRD